MGKDKNSTNTKKDSFANRIEKIAKQDLEELSVKERERSSGQRFKKTEKESISFLKKIIREARELREQYPDGTTYQQNQK